MEENKNVGEKSFIIFLDDDDSVKEKVAYIKKEEGGVTIQISTGKPFFIPYNRVLKIKRFENDNS